MEMRIDLRNLGWSEVVDQLMSRGWVRLRGAVSSDASEALEHAGPGPWHSLPETEGSAGVRQAGLACHSAVDQAPDVVRLLCGEIKSGVDSATGTSVAYLPAFNHAEWCRAESGEKFITAHRDPDTAGGLIAVLTARGRAVFRIWDWDGPSREVHNNLDRATEWESDDGDLVLMTGGGWPLATSRCPVHEVESPASGDRVTLTLRHNKGGYGADYFS
ncbi:MAG TPA: hypothetical protein VGR26_18255 [Acidimicrobiales bacterium]|nr:hypothetical protein [Acidimicrobiales bacterium]